MKYSGVAAVSRKVRINAHIIGSVCGCYVVQDYENKLLQVSHVKYAQCTYELIVIHF